MKLKQLFHATSVTQNPFVKKIMTDYKYITSLAVMAALLVTTGVGAFEDLTLMAAMEEVSTETVETPMKPIEMVIPTQKVEKPYVVKTTTNESIIANAKTYTANKPFMPSTAFDTLQVMSQPNLKGYSIMINGKEFGFFTNKNEADSLIDGFKKDFTTPKVTDVFFKEDVYVMPVTKTAYSFKGYSEMEKAKQYLKKGTDVEKIHTVTDGESFWNISKKYEISIDALIKANPTATPEKIKAGDRLSLVVPSPMLTVCTVEHMNYQEVIPSEVKYTEAKNLFKGQSKVTVVGKTGLKAIEAQLVKENGVAVKRYVLKEKVLSKPTIRVVAKGTIQPPKTAATGVFAKPFSRGKFSSPFGRRWGRMHSGVDWSMPVGSPIKAADGGRVELSERDGAYGYCIIINHGNGLKTLYAHNSKLLVKPGDKVYKGQLIAKSGNTGRSTGPHLHFEVIKNGSHQNPLKYFK